MDSDELLPGEQTPLRGLRGSSASARRLESDEDKLKRTKEEDGGLKNDDEGDDDESFVTMEEIKDGCGASGGLGRTDETDPDFYAKLGYGPLMPRDARAKKDSNKRPSKVILKDYYFEENGRVNSINNYNNNRNDNKEDDGNSSTKQIRQSSFRRLSHRLSREMVRRRSSLVETLPETPAGWTILVSGLASALLGYELQLQRSLSCPPWVFGQCGNNYDNNLPLQMIYKMLTQTPESLLSRPINPSLFVGTRGTLSSVAAYALLGPSSKKHHVTFRQVLTMSADGARIALDWELPPPSSSASSSAIPMSDHERKQQCLKRGGIHKPVILILTGMNNDTSFGYIKSLQRAFTDRGWIAVAQNFRGVGGVPLATPRCYNGGYTGDLRSVVHYLSSRLAPDVPLFIVGNSLSANIVTKYLGEEGLSGTLPCCVKGGVALGNPLLMHVENLSTPWKEVLALGVKKDVLHNWPTFRHMMHVPTFRNSILGVLKARTIGDVDAALAPIFVRNESHYPFAVRIGFRDAEDYWADSSSFKYIKHISVPCLQIVAGDDIICYKSFQKKLAHCMQNPYVMCVETKCGGHLGWQESPPDANAFGVGTSWADRATADFFEAIIRTGTLPQRQTTPDGGSNSHSNDGLSAPSYGQSTPHVHFRSKL